MAMDEVYDFLRKQNRKLSTIEISKGVGIRVNSVRKNLQNLFERNLVEKTVAKYIRGTMFLWEVKK